MIRSSKSPVCKYRRFILTCTLTKSNCINRLSRANMNEPKPTNCCEPSSSKTTDPPKESLENEQYTEPQPFKRLSYTERLYKTAKNVGTYPWEKRSYAAGKRPVGTQGPYSHLCLKCQRPAQKRHPLHDWLKRRFGDNACEKYEEQDVGNNPGCGEKSFWTCPSKDCKLPWSRKN